jgi:hypothetical protein
MAMIEWENEAVSFHFVRFFSLLTLSICFPTTGLLKLVVTGQKLFVADRFVAGLLTSLLQTWQKQLATGLLEQVGTTCWFHQTCCKLFYQTCYLLLVLNRFVVGCFNKLLPLCCQQLATDLFPQACYRLTEPTARPVATCWQLAASQ